MCIAYAYAAISIAATTPPTSTSGRAFLRATARGVQGQLRKEYQAMGGQM